MKMSPEQLAEHDEVVTLTNEKGDVAVYKLNHFDKSVCLKGGAEDEKEWRHTNGSYEAVLKALGRPLDGSKPVELPPVEDVPVKY